MAVENMIGKLPTNGEASYGTRPIGGIMGWTVHYTASPAGTSLWNIAAYQTSEAARGQTGNGTPFPGLAYTYGVPLSGTPVQAWPLETRVWHSAAHVNGIPRNASHIGVVFIGDGVPTPQQIRGIAEAILDSEKKLNAQGNAVRATSKTVEGHKDAPYPTSCPGSAWPTWKPALMGAIETLRNAMNNPPDEGNGGWQDPGFSRLYRANRSLMGKPTTGPFSDSLGNVYQRSGSGTAVWNREHNRNLFIPSDVSLPIASI
jgi:hypothetical protein